jgi:RelA/SpoT family (p)ppGpp synthetase
MYEFMKEMQTLAFRELEPEAFDSITKRLEQLQEGGGDRIARISSGIKMLLSRQGIEAEVTGREKHPYSIWRKMAERHISFEQLSDVMAFRAIVPDISNCYDALGIIHRRWPMVPGRFKDYISTPKRNGYRSLHTSVIHNEKVRIEIQIRSREMHAQAEYGYAAHWAYKADIAEPVAQTAWIQDLVEILDHAESPEELLEHTRMAMYQDRIFAFTPKGELIQLPKGATPVDFAYAIHTTLGDTAVGAKVNGRVVPLRTPIENGDQVEIITSRKQKPSEDWLNIVTTSRAKSKIKNSLREEKRKIADDGKEILERKLNQLKANFTNENINVIANLYKMPSSMDLFYNIAKNTLNLNDLKQLKVLGGNLEIIKPEKVVKPKDEEISYQADENNGEIPKNAELVIFDESSKFPYEFAKCCSAIPGDDVIGFISINGVIKIHRTGCPNVINLASKYGYRIIKTRWTAKTTPAFLTTVKLTGLDDIGVINKLTTVISGEMKLNMQSVSIETNEGIFEGIIKVFVKDNDQVNKLIAKLKSIPGINSVIREEI